jgi:hypothetical protein
MNPEDVRKLIGGYATGSLSEAERKLLFEAALNDEDLFDELAGEQVLREILEEPGARQRLLSALGAQQKSINAPWWSRPWPWMGAAVTVAVVIIMVVAQRTPVPPPQEIAQVLKSTEPVASPPPPPPPAPRPAAAPQALRKVAPVPPAPQAAEKTPVDAIAEARADKAAPQPLADAPPPPPPPAARAFGAAAGFAKGGRAEALAANLVSVFGFNYPVRADGVLEIIPSSPGFLSVADGDSVLRPNGSVPAGMPVRVQLPAGTMSVTIGFYAVQGITGMPVRRDDLSGTVTDQDPPNRRISIQLFLTPGTQ